MHGDGLGPPTYAHSTVLRGTGLDPLRLSRPSATRHPILTLRDPCDAFVAVCPGGHLTLRRPEPPADHINLRNSRVGYARIGTAESPLGKKGWRGAVSAYAEGMLTTSLDDVNEPRGAHDRG